MKFLIYSLLAFIVFCTTPVPKIEIGNEYRVFLENLTDTLLETQILDKDNTDYGALQCKRCDIRHTRAAEAMYPFAVVYKNSKNSKYLQAAIRLGNWLIKQQLKNGAWKETPEEWTGTTTDQLLMMVRTFSIVKDSLTSKEYESWQNSIQRAADYLVNVMDPDFASINYCATSTATLASVFQLFPDSSYIRKADKLARQVIDKMDRDGFIHGEGGRSFGIKYGSDIGYELDMSLWGLALYARITSNSFVDSLVFNAVKTHFYFVYPDGSIDGSWGVRSNKWTTFGSSTADGCQVLFTLYGPRDSRCYTAAYRNLTYLKSLFKSEWIGYGPHYYDIFDVLPCNYTTFARAKNLALSLELLDETNVSLPALPSDKIGWMQEFKTVDVTVTRTKNFMTTITAYRYKDIFRRYKSKYMHRATGGSISNLWVQDYGFLQLAGQTEYYQWEPMHFPEAPGILPVTPRIEFSDKDGYFTNLYEYDGQMTCAQNNGKYIIQTDGQLKDRELFPGGIGYQWRHVISDNVVEKQVLVKYHGKRDTVRIVEPVVWNSGMQFIQKTDRHVEILAKDKKFNFNVTSGNAKLIIGRNKEKYWAPFPSIKCYPIELEIFPDSSRSQQKVSYKIELE